MFIRFGNSFDRLFNSTLSGYLFEGEGAEGTPAPATSGTSGAAPTSAAPAPAAATPAASAPAAATPAATTQPPATGGGQEGWVPSYRLREAREAAERTFREQFATREAELRAEAARYQAQIQALTGVTPPNPQNAEVQAVREQFSRLFPGLSQLEERAQELQELVERAGDLETQSTHYWQQYGRSAMDKLFSNAEKTYGTPLGEEGKRSLHAMFTGWVGSSPELTARYASDPTIVDEFWNAFSSSFVEPSRRAAAASVVARTGTPTPQDRGGAVPPVTPGPKPSNLDERANQAWAQYQQMKRD